MKVVMTGFATRCLNNWMPLADKIRREGGICDLAVFPRISDPSNHSLLQLEEHVLFNEVIREDFTFTTQNALERLCRKISDYDLILMTSCVTGPELDIKAELLRQGSNAIVMGLQHGFYQLWDSYRSNWASFDYFGVFGQAFAERFEPQQRSKIIALGLPKLDLAQPVTAGKSRKILFCLQTTVSMKTISTLAISLEELGFQVIFKGHPEFPEKYAALRSHGFEFVDAKTTLGEAMLEADYIITTGSTVVLEALNIELPVVVIPEQAGNEYAIFGIVAEHATGESVMNVLQRYRSQDFRHNLRWQLEQHSGPSSERTLHAYAALQQLINNKSKN